MKNSENSFSSNTDDGEDKLFLSPNVKLGFKSPKHDTSSTSEKRPDKRSGSWQRLWPTLKEMKVSWWLSITKTSLISPEQKREKSKHALNDLHMKVRDSNSLIPLKNVSAKIGNFTHSTFAWSLGTCFSEASFNHFPIAKVSHTCYP